MFAHDTEELLREINQLPHNTTALKLDELVRRARTVRSHAKVMARLRERVGWFGLVSVRRSRMLRELNQVLADVAAEERKPSNGLVHGLSESYRVVLMEQLEATSSWMCWQLPQTEKSDLLRLEMMMEQVLPGLQIMLDGDAAANDPQHALTTIEQEPLGRQWLQGWMVPVAVGMFAAGSLAVWLYKQGCTPPVELSKVAQKSVEVDATQ